MISHLDLACKNLGREFVGIERHPLIFRLAKERIETGAVSARTLALVKGHETFLKALMDSKCG